MRPNLGIWELLIILVLALVLLTIYLRLSRRKKRRGFEVMPPAPERPEERP